MYNILHYICIFMLGHKLQLHAQHIQNVAYCGRKYLCPWLSVLWAKAKFQDQEEATGFKTKVTTKTMRFKAKTN